MKMIIAAAVAALAAVATVAPADARDGCGRGYHRDRHGHCVPNWRNRHRHGDVLVIGRYYNGRGYWDGRRYYRHRERWHNGWRYR